MKIAILGGTGRTGHQLVEQALRRGYQLRVLARTPQKLEIKDNNLEVLQGNSLNYDDISSLINGCDIVISVMGPTKNTPENLMERTASNICQAMKENGIERILYLTGAGVRSKHDNPGIVDKIFGLLLRLFSRKILEDSKKGVKQIKSCDVNYTIVRVPRLTTAEKKGNYTINYVGEISSSLTRADLATAILDLIDDQDWYNKMPAISN